MRLQIALTLLSGLLLSGCGGPLLSQPIAAGSMIAEGTAHGTYCLPRHFLEVTVINGTVDEQFKRSKRLVVVYGDTKVFATRIAESDTSRVYRLGYNESSFSSDTIKVEYDGLCVLKKVSSRVRDESPSVVRDLASTVIQAVSGAPTARVQRSRSGGLRAGEVPADEITMLLDVGPATYRSEQDRMNAALDANGAGINVEIRPMAGAATLPAAAASEAVEGIFFAQPQAYIFSVQAKRAEGKKATIYEGVFYSANGVAPQYIAVDRSAFVERYTEILFARGLPFSIVTTKPSEAKEFATIPLDITTAILRAPVEAVKWDTDKAAAQADLYNNQKIMIERQMKLIEAQDNLLKFMQSRSSATVPSDIDDPKRNATGSDEAAQSAAPSDSEPTEPRENDAARPGPSSDEVPDGNNSAPPR
jgi:hypothetical protein